MELSVILLFIEKKSKGFYPFDYDGTRCHFVYSSLKLKKQSSTKSI